MALFLFKMALDISEIKTFPQKQWNEESSLYWLELCNQLQTYTPPKNDLVIKNKERKWEVVSAYQKCVRRGLKDIALWLVSGFDSFEKKEWAYFWRRICVTAAEDVGYANPELMNFVVACSTIYRPSNTTIETLKIVWSFLTEKMVESAKSRIWCQTSNIEIIGRNFTPKGLDEWELSVLKEVTKNSNFNGKKGWSFKNNWRAGDMLKFQGYDFDLECIKGNVTPSFQILSGLPDFCYDQHTRVGKQMCVRLTGVGRIKGFFSKHVDQDKVRDIGSAIFFVEGALINESVMDARMDKLEAKFISGSHNMSLNLWYEFLEIIQELVKDGVVNKIRKSVLDKSGYLL